MKLKSSLALLGMGAMGVVMYQNIKNGNMKKLVSKMDNLKKKAMNDLEEMI